MSEPISILFQLLMAIVAGPIWPITNIIYFDVYFMCLTFLQHDAGEKVGEDDKDSIGCQNKDKLVFRCLEDCSCLLSLCEKEEQRFLSA
jgi:hypothetical protein